MIAAFERRMTAISAAVIGAGFVAVVIGVTLFAAALYVGTLTRDQQDAVTEARTILTAAGGISDARVAGDLVADRFFRPQLRITILDGRRRVQIFRPEGATAPAIVAQNVRDDPSSDYVPKSLAGRASLAFATLVGLHATRALVGPLIVVARVDPFALADDLVRVLPMVALALLLAIVLAIALARVLVHQTLRPLGDVTAALERFARGDFTPNTVIAHEQHTLRHLAEAYNGAVEQVHAAFNERDRAHSAMRQFIADAGHQLRTPLTVVRGFIGILMRGDLRDPSDGERILSTMNRQTLLMGSLIEKLILLDRWEQAPAERPEPIDLSQLVEDVVAPIASSVPERNVRLRLRASNTLVRIDPSDCAHALTNLVENALKYAPAGRIDVTLERSRSIVRLTVADDGPGMDDDEARHAFDRFYRGPRNRAVEGSGLGLAIARRAVERAGGRIVLETAPGAGCRFTITLPCEADRRVAIPPQRPATAPELAGHAGTGRFA